MEFFCFNFFSFSFVVIGLKIFIIIAKKEMMAQPANGALLNKSDLDKSSPRR
jgi:hypothetical protein